MLPRIMERKTTKVNKVVQGDELNFTDGVATDAINYFRKIHCASIIRLLPRPVLAFLARSRTSGSVTGF